MDVSWSTCSMVSIESFWPCHTSGCVIVWDDMSSPSHELSDDDSFDPSRFHGNMVHPGSLTTCSHILVWVRDSREQLQSVRDMDYSTIAFLPHHRVWHISTFLRLSRQRFITARCSVKYIQHNVSLWAHLVGTSLFYE